MFCHWLTCMVSHRLQCRIHGRTFWNRDVGIIVTKSNLLRFWKLWVAVEGKSVAGNSRKFQFTMDILFCCLPTSYQTYANFITCRVLLVIRLSIFAVCFSLKTPYYFQWIFDRPPESKIIIIILMLFCYVSYMQIKWMEKWKRVFPTKDLK